jgi:hypothetical protein
MNVIVASAPVPSSMGSPNASVARPSDLRFAVGTDRKVLLFDPSLSRSEVPN